MFSQFFQSQTKKIWLWIVPLLNFQTFCEKNSCYSTIFPLNLEATKSNCLAVVLLQEKEESFTVTNASPRSRSKLNPSPDNKNKKRMKNLSSSDSSPTSTKPHWREKLVRLYHIIFLSAFVTHMHLLVMWSPLIFLAGSLSSAVLLVAGTTVSTFIKKIKMRGCSFGATTVCRKQLLFYVYDMIWFLHELI